ncbi:MAG: hypothetical protein VYB54_02145 [Pseudomonadota bacterium]|nr:hypothetical protein [Pseudomonadota bacterium]
MAASATRTGPAILALAVLLVAAGLPARAETRVVGPDETAVEVPVTEPGGEVTFRIDRLCYGSNAPTAISRVVLRFFELARQGFVTDATGRTVWAGGALDDLRNAAAQAGPLLAVPVRGIDSPRGIAAAARAERDRASGDPVALFPVPKGEAGRTEFTVAAPLDAGDSRTVAVSGCYTPAQLGELMRRRGEAAGAFLAALDRAGD